jgi:ABC-type branched-subunit amino acid transport system substrate-binding protein
MLIPSVMRRMRLHHLLTVLLLWCWFVAPIPALAEQEQLKIGFILPLSGDLAFLGNGIRDGALLAKEDLRNSGTQIEMIFEDNAGELSPSAVIAAKLIGVQKVDALVSIISGVGKILKPIANKAEVINIGICSDTDVADGKFSFINYLTAEQGVAKYLEEFSRTFGKRNVLGVFALNESGFQKIADELQRKASTHAVIKFIETFDKGMTDFRPLLLRVSTAKPDAFLVLGLSPEIELLVKQARSLRITTPVTSIEGFGLASDKSPFEGSWFIDSAVPNEQFRNRFAKTYGREVTPGVGHSYDSVMLLAQSFKKCSTKLSNCHADKAVKEFRRLSEFQGSTGKLYVRPDGVIWSEASVKTIRDGKPELVAP